MLRKKPIILFLAIAGLAFSEGLAVYLHGSPSLPLSSDWFDYVNKYPAMEGGLSVEIPTKTVFTVRIEGNYVSLPSGGVLENGEAYFGCIGGVVKNDIGLSAKVFIGPQLILGQVYAKGRYKSLDYGEEENYRVDFNSKGEGFGIGIIAGIVFEPTKHLRIGANLATSYFNVSNDQVEIIGFNYDNPDAGESESIYRYEGEYTALSLRLVFGYEFLGEGR